MRELLGGVEDAWLARPSEAGAVWEGRIAERRREQIIEAAAFARDGGLGRLDQVFENVLLVEAVDKLHRRDAVLGLRRGARRRRS